MQEESRQLLELGFVTHENRNVGVPQQLFESRQPLLEGDDRDGTMSGGQCALDDLR